MNKVKGFFAILGLVFLASCSSVPENVKLGIVKLNAAAKLLSVHNSAHCQAYIAELNRKIQATEDAAEKDALIEQLRNEIEYHSANETLPEVTQELEDWAFERDIEEDN